MGIINKLLGRERETAAAGGARPAEGPAFREGVPVGFKREEPMLTITDGAKEKIQGVLQSQDPPAAAIRVSATGPGRYAMHLEPEGQPATDDTVLPYDGFRIFVDPQSVPFVEGASLDYLETFGGGGFKFTNPNLPGQRPRKEPPEGPEGEIWRRAQLVIDEEINPAVAGHGGYINLLEVKDGTAFIEMGGGCQGCAMSAMTLKNGVERLLKDAIPEIEEILDVTDHAEGRNPYYAAT